VPQTEDVVARESERISLGGWMLRSCFRLALTVMRVEPYDRGRVDPAGPATHHHRSEECGCTTCHEQFERALSQA
jgi:hypothetical protein